MTSGYLRHPDVHGDHLVCCAGDEVWLAPVAGGRAWRLTSDRSPVRHPRFSPDGRRIAWASSRDGAWEVYVLELDSGATERLTYWGSDTTTVIGWRDDETVLAVSSAGEINLRHTTVRAVRLDGRAERLGYGPTSMIAFHPAGAVALSSRYSRPPEYWKRYRGGTASRLWLDPAGAGEWRRLLPDIDASLTSPFWYGDRLAFASDLEADLPGNPNGQANLYSVSADGDDLTRHTQHTVEHGYLRDPVSDGRTIVYHARGVLHRMSGLNADPEPIELTLAAPLPGRMPRPLEPTENLTQVRPDHGGNGSVVEWRGNAFYLTHREGPARALAADSGVRVREPRVLGDTGRACYVTDADGEDAIEIRALDALTPPRRIAGGQMGRVLSLEPDPAGERLAVISHDGRVRVLDLESGELRQVGHSQDGEATDPAFSPDGRYLAWSEPTASHRYLVLVDLSDPGSEPVRLTGGRFSDFSPSFTRDGKYLAFLSARTFDPRYDSHTFDLGFAGAVRPYLVPLAATTPAPFGPNADGWPIATPKQPEEPGQSGEAGQSGGAGAGGQAGPKQGPAVTTDPVDVDGFEQRLVPFPVPSGGYRALRATKAGVAWIRESDKGVLGAARADVPGEAPGDALETYLFATRRTEELTDRVDAYQVSGDGAQLVLRAGDAVRVVPADRAVKDDEDPAVVTVDLSRLRFELDPVAEWRQMFDEQGRLMRDHFWREDLDGVDWAAVLHRYRPIVDRLGSHDDLVDLLWETVAELNTSHAYVMPQPRPELAAKRIGLLGADLAPAEDGWEITAILPGETSDPQARSPLRAAGVGASVGDRIVAVDGRPVDPRFGPYATLAGTADQPVELTLRAGSGEDRRVVVRPLDSEEPIRYQAWVAGRAAYVREHSDGRLGYLHIPDMASPGWAQLHRDIDLATRAEGVIVDVRYNRGGHTSQLVIERLARRVIGWDLARQVRQPEEYPTQAVRGPVIFVTNEFAGSDGDIVCAAAQALRLGPVVGVRSWGGVVGIDGRFALVDGTGVTQPRYAFWLEGYGWGVENHGVDPDIEVPITPADWDGPADPQLDRAIAEAQRLLAERPAAQPPTPEPPRAGH